MTNIAVVLNKELDTFEGAAETNSAADLGGRTKYGISQTANPEAWSNGPPTRETALGIFQRKYVDGPGFASLPDCRLRDQLIDFGINSGPAMAIMKLQVVLGLQPDGILGPATRAAILARNLDALNNLLVGERIRMIGRLVTKNASQLVWLNGWLNRATDFLV